MAVDDLSLCLEDESEVGELRVIYRASHVMCVVRFLWTGARVEQVCIKKIIIVVPIIAAHEDHGAAHHRAAGLPPGAGQVVVHLDLSRGSGFHIDFHQVIQVIQEPATKQVDAVCVAYAAVPPSLRKLLVLDRYRCPLQLAAWVRSKLGQVNFENFASSLDSGGGTISPGIRCLPARVQRRGAQRSAMMEKRCRDMFGHAR